MNSLLSVLVPVYNTSTYLEKCLNSILKQKYKNIEVIAVNDGSTDNSAEILNRLSLEDSRLKVIHQKNKGLIGARETAIKAATGEYVTFVDSDDWVEDDYFLLLMEAMQKNDADICIGGMCVDYSNHTDIPFRLKEEVILCDDAPLAEMFDFKYYRWELCSKIYKRGLVDGIRVPPHIVCGEDLARNWQIFANSSRAVCVPTTGYHYVQRTDSVRKIKALPYEKTVSYVLAGMAEDMQKQSPRAYESYMHRLREFMVTDLLLMLSSDSDDIQMMKRMHRSIRRDIAIYMEEASTKRRKMILLWLCMPFAVVYMNRWTIKWYLNVRNRT